jgi:hypothetical protein
MPPIKNANDYARPAEGVPSLGAATVIHLARRRGQAVAEPTADAPAAPEVIARVNHGRWIGECGLPDPARGGEICKNAQYIALDDPRFFCIVCENADHGGAWRDVTLPADPEAVEAAILDLPEGEQNWEPEA